MDTRTVIFFVMMCFLSVQSQDNIFTITPNNSICIGESVIITCYLYPPTANEYSAFGLLSVNESDPEIANAINSDYGHLGYTATHGIPIMGDSARIQLTITSFQVSDSNTVFGCHAQLASDGSDAGVMINGTASLAAPPSSPVSLTAGYNSPTCFDTVQLAWTPGASDRDIEMYFLSLNGVTLASLGPVTSYNHTTTLQRDTEYTYSVVAMSCAGYSTQTAATSISVGNPPSSPNVTFSQTDTISCSNVLMWPSPSSDRSITSYSISRDNVSIADNVPHTVTEYTDSYELDIDTTYRYSVVAISCAGSSTATDVYSPRIEGTSLATGPHLVISYYNTTDELFVNWTLNPSQPITVTYRLELVYSYTQNNVTHPYDETYTFSQTSTDTDYSLALTKPTFSSSGPVVLVITATLRITKQCNTTITDGIELTATTKSTFTAPPADPDPDPDPPDTGWVVIVAAVVGGCCLFCGSALVLTGVTILIIVYVSKKKDPKKRSETQELQEQMYSQINKGNKTSKQQPVEEKMEGLYAEVDHTLPKPDNPNRPEPIEETLYSQVHQPMDGPNQ